MSLTLGIDQGSSATKALLLDRAGAVVWQKRITVESNMPVAGRCEQNPAEILASVRTALSEAADFARGRKTEIQGIGLSCQRSAVCAFTSKDGTALSPLLTFRDRRAADAMNFSLVDRSYIEKQSGLRCLPDYAASKIAWLQQQCPDRDILVGTLDSYLLYHLLDTPEFLVEHSMAARTLLYSLESRRWDGRLCELFGVDMGRLPQIIPSTPSGLTVNGIPLIAVLGDAQAALLNVLVAGRSAVLNMGTISSLSVATGNSVPTIPGAACSLLYFSQEARFLVEAVTNASGAVVEFLQHALQKRSSSADLAGLDVAGFMPGSCAYLPVHGTGSPNWHAGLPLAFSCPMELLSDQELAACCLYSIGSFIARNILWLRLGGVLTAEHLPLAVTGGLTQSKMLLQFIADVAAIQLEVVRETEGSARGITLLPDLVRGTARQPEPNSSRVIVEPAQSKASEHYANWLELESLVLRGETAKFVTVPYE